MNCFLNEYITLLSLEIRKKKRLYWHSKFKVKLDQDSYTTVWSDSKTSRTVKWKAWSSEYVWMVLYVPGLHVHMTQL